MLGTVKEYRRDGAWGFVIPDDLHMPDCFVHHSFIVAEKRKKFLNSGDRVEFDYAEDEQGPTAGTQRAQGGDGGAIVSKNLRNYMPVPLRAGRCVNHEYHFHGAAKEVYSYLMLHADKRDGFVFSSVDDIVAHTKRYQKSHKPFKKRHCERILSEFRTRKILGDYETRFLDGIGYRSGWQVRPHDEWTTQRGERCEFRYPESAIAQSVLFQEYVGQNVGHLSV